MDTPLNLTPERGPSVWDAPRQSPPTWGLVALAIGATASAAAWRRPRQPWLLTVGLGGLAFGVLSMLPMDAARSRRRTREAMQTPDALDAALADSFPASDPPAASAPTTPATTPL